LQWVLGGFFALPWFLHIENIENMIRFQLLVKFMVEIELKQNWSNRINLLKHSIDELRIAVSTLN